MFFELGETFSRFEVGFGRSVSSLCVTQWLLAGSGHLIGHGTWFDVFWILGMDLDGSNAKMGMGDTGFLALSLCVWQTFNGEFSLGSRCSLGLCDEILHSYRFRIYRFPHLLQKHVQRDSVLLWFVLTISRRFSIRGLCHVHVGPAALGNLVRTHSWISS